MLSGITEKTLLPFQGAINVTTVPGALPWAMRSLGFQPADSNGGVSFLISDEPIIGHDGARELRGLLWGRHIKRV